MAEYINPQINEIAKRVAVNRAASSKMPKVSREYITSESFTPMKTKIAVGRISFQMSAFALLLDGLYVHRNMETTASIIAIIFVGDVGSPYIIIENSIGITSDILLATVVITIPVFRDEIPTRKNVAMNRKPSSRLIGNQFAETMCLTGKSPKIMNPSSVAVR